MASRPALVVFIVCLCPATPVFAADEPGVRAGVAAVDITPDYPVRLSGFGFRREESTGVTQRIWAKALAIASQGEGQQPAVVLTVDNLGVPLSMTREVAERLKNQGKLEPARLAITSTHTHTAPMLTGVAPTLFGMPIPPEHQARIERYTRELTDKLEQVALAALADLKPAKLEFGVGAVDFAINRRTPGGPVDHDLPVLAVRGPDGALRAVYVSYACHCVTLADNQISGDWAGYVQEAFAKSHPDAMVLTSVGCGADSNPSSGVTGDKHAVAADQGAQIAREIERLVKQPLTPLDQPIASQTGEIELMFDTHPTRDEWHERAKREDAVGHHARVQLAKLDRGEQLQTVLAYPIQTWAFGDQLAMVFLPGEVVVDYSLRLKGEFDRSRLWVNGYSNDVPCYIPSERILKEGGYEGGDAMIYYDRPTKLAACIEQKIIDEIHRQVPAKFVALKGTEGVSPRSAANSLRAIRTKPGLEVELVAAEPLVTSPVAIDWAADGGLWVCEMFDYPTGADGNWQPGGRVKRLRDTDGDGTYDASTVFLENLPFPTGLTAWGKGVLVCAAPDILYAEDTDADGKANRVDKLFTGFATDNYQARINSLTLGLDHWVYGANGLLGGVISGRGTEKLDIRNRDFRFRPLDGPMEPVTGLTQQGRVRDDWGRWFGCDNSSALLHFPHEARYLRRNPHVPAPPPAVAPAGDYDVGRVYPVSRMLERFNDPGQANRLTSACGLALYRDTMLGDGYAGNAFVCEPVHNLVHRMIILDANGMTPARRRAPDEHDSEFLASTDNWFRPVQVRTGPDGALYVVDMYRFLIEHPRWIPAERLARLDARAGAEMGRIYRVVPQGNRPRPVRDLSKLAGAELAGALDSPNGTERDRAHVELLLRHDPAALPALRKLAAAATPSQVRVQALCVLDGLKALDAEHLTPALADPDPRVRAHAIRLCEPLLRDPSAPGTAALRTSLLKLAETDDAAVVRRQLAFTLGEWHAPEAGQALAALALRGIDDAEMRTAVLSSATPHCAALLTALMAAPQDARADWIPPLVATAAASDDPAALAVAVRAVLPAAGEAPTADHLAALASLLDALDRRHPSASKRPDVAPRVATALAAARRVAADDGAPVPAREAALRVLGRGEAEPAELDLLCRLLTAADSAPELRAAALAALRRQHGAGVADRLLAAWQRTGPAARADVVNLLLGRDEWARALLAAAKRNVVRPSEVALADRQRLLASEDAEIRALAGEAFTSQPTSSRAEVMERYRAVATLTGDRARGAAVFAEQCATCHRLGGVGHDVGPDLAALAGRDVEYLLKNILDPSAVIEPRFTYYQVVTTDRRTLAGVVKSETATDLTVQAGGGVTETVRRPAVKSIRASGVSMMPEGVEAAVDPQGMADLIAFLKSGAARKTFAGNEPRTVAPSGDDALLLPAAAAEIYGDGIAFEPEFENIGMWHGADDRVAWNATVARAGTFDVYLDYACAEHSAGNAMRLAAGQESLETEVAATGPDWSRYRQMKVGTLQLAAGPLRVEVRPAGPLRGALIDLRTVALVPAGAAPQWPAPLAVAGGGARRPPPPPPAAPDEVARDAAAVAKVILDPNKSNEAREAAVNANPQFAADLIEHLTADLKPGSPAEYERIPWIWRVAVACGRRDDAGQMKRVLAVSLPKDDAPLRDWQAVVIGGGIVNGANDRGHWPAARVAEILKDDEPLQKRFARAIELAAPMADDEKVPSGTRYDALRMLGAGTWEAHGDQLLRYLKKGTHEELQMGAVSGLADVDAPEATRALLDALSHLEGRNRDLALDALLRGESCATALLDAVDAGKLKPAALGPDRLKRLREHESKSVRDRVARLPDAK
jgi:putative membrane-bound dehydrogenase-like protein